MEPNLNTEEAVKEENPLISIFFKPRSTIRYVLNDYSESTVTILLIVNGAIQSLYRASDKNLGDSSSLFQIFALALTIGTLGSVLAVYLAAYLLDLTGSWIGGKGNYQKIKAAIAYSSVLFTASGVFLIIQIILFGGEVFQKETPMMDDNEVLVLVLSLLQLTLIIWGVVVFFKTLSEVQKFSVWKAILNAVIAFAIIFIPLIGIVALATL